MFDGIWSALFERLNAVGSGIKSGPEVGVGGKRVEGTGSRADDIEAIDTVFLPWLMRGAEDAGLRSRLLNPLSPLQKSLGKISNHRGWRRTKL